MKPEPGVEYNAATRLKSGGVKPSYHRLKILEYIMENRNHPSVDTIYRALHPDIPTLSKTTVYNTLKLLLKKNILFGLNIRDEEVLYDLVQKPHGHLHCSVCGRVFDVEVEDEVFEALALEGHAVSEIQINFKGTCSGCQSTKDFPDAN